MNLSREDVLFYFTTTGYVRDATLIDVSWMMWNWLVSGLAVGLNIVLFDGNPLYPSSAVLWQMAQVFVQRVTALISIGFGHHNIRHECSISRRRHGLGLSTRQRV